MAITNKTISCLLILAIALQLLAGLLEIFIYKNHQIFKDYLPFMLLADSSLRVISLMFFVFFIFDKHSKLAAAEREKILWRNGYYDLERRWKEYAVSSLYHYLEATFENTQVTCYTVYYKNGTLACKIGDDDCLVELDLTVQTGNMDSDFKSALMAAYEKFLAQKT